MLIARPIYGARKTNAQPSNAKVSRQLSLRRGRFRDRDRLPGADDMRLLDLSAQERINGQSARRPVQPSLWRRLADRVPIPHNDRAPFLLQDMRHLSLSPQARDAGLLR